ncbi:MULTISPECIES: DUF6957 family protein [Pseudomonas]|uniref:DUF6957 domain-containing protein n=1 Tax=Pseudomonas putida TaxID=303 RepID=A0A7V8ECQ0_PSEPU|nr:MULTISPECIES: hypothetical protein [Pseudomonas]KAF0252192.1 hypothetical protein GN299_24735 [Pseudomonas putida]MDD1984509.1 hypothetical protein [Pseudomonas asiatica]
MSDAKAGSSAESDLLTEDHVPAAGLEISAEAARALVAERFPRRSYCIVEGWTLFEPDLTQDEQARVKAAGLVPLIVFAHCVVDDSEGRFPQGGWVRSTMCTSLVDDVFASTRNTVYVLLGPGRRQKASLSTIFSFF